MEANEAPEKIYVQLPSRNWIGRTWNETPIKEGDNPNWKNATSIEYCRTDAFIEKVDKFISSFFHPDDTELKKGILDGFHKYMKGE